MTPIHIVPGSWTHTCLRIPGKQGIPTKIHMEGMGACLYCGQPGPIQQKQIDADNARLLGRGGER
jgi:hypothetical protein